MFPIRMLSLYILLMKCHIVLGVPGPWPGGGGGGGGSEESYALPPPPMQAEGPHFSHPLSPIFGQLEKLWLKV